MSSMDSSRGGPCGSPERTKPNIYEDSATASDFSLSGPGCIIKQVRKEQGCGRRETALRGIQAEKNN